MMKYLLIGNPNVGKSSLFNTITNSYAHVGNWSGVTVQQTIGEISGTGELIDLPGTYGVSPSSEDEGLVTHVLLNEHYNSVINIVDSTHLKRNLHLTIQLLELGVPTFLVLNMIDELKRSGLDIDIDKMSEILGVDIYPISVKDEIGIDELKEGLTNIKARNPLRIFYGKIIDDAIDEIKLLLRTEVLHVKKCWLAIQLLEGNEKVFDYLEINNKEKIRQIIAETEQKIIKNQEASSLKGAIFMARRRFINNLLFECVIQVSEKDHVKYFNRKIDKIVTNPVLGILSFFMVMFLVYFLTFDLIGASLSDLVEYIIFDKISPMLSETLPGLGISSHILKLITDGIIAGVGGVLIFVPQVMTLFFLLAILEGTGYMARVAIMMDHLLSRFGLNGKSIVPMITGLGCNVPAILATKTIPNKHEKILTILIIPFMSCSARIPIYALIANLLFDKYVSLIIMGMYVLGFIIALISAKLFSVSILKNTQNNFVLEIPPYRVPHWKNVWRQSKLYTRGFIENAGKYIFFGAILFWFLQYIGPGGVAVDSDESILALISGWIAPIFTPLGFGSWQATSSIIGGFLAKEFLAASMLILYGGEQAIVSSFTTASAISFIVFSLLYIPCLATVGVIKSETKSWKWTLFSIMYSFTVAYLISFIFYHVVNLFL